jgi:phosphate transport system protein
MTRTRFHQELDELKHRILAMAGMAEQAVDLAVQAYSQRDLAMCQRVLNNEPAINRAEREVDEFAVDLLAMQQPMAIDLPVDIPAMAAKVRKMVRDALQSFIEGDTELAKRVLEADDEVDRMNKEAFSTLSICMQTKPDSAVQALDALSIARNLERVADHATNIAEDVIFWVRGADVRHSAGQTFTRI